MELRKFYNEYEDYLKMGVKTVGSAAGFLLAGFFVYFWRYKKQLMSGENIEKKSEAKVVPVEKLEKLVNKIKNLIIHNMTLMHDLSHSYNPTEFVGKEDDIEIEDVQVESEPKNEENSEILMSDSLLSINLDKQNTSKINNQKKAAESRVDAFKKEYKPLVNNPKFRDDKLLSYEIAKIKQFELEPDEYYNALKKNMNNEKIKKNIKIIADFKKHFDRDELMKIDFGDAISKNYLKIITNIYYLNLRKTLKKFKDEFLDKGYDFKDANETANAFNDIYKSFLQATRRDVLSFFNVVESDVLTPKVMLRIFPFYFSPYHQIRIKYEKINQEVNTLIKKIQLTGSIDELYNDAHPDAIIKPVDQVIDFSHLLVAKVSPPVIQATTVEEDNRNKRVMNKFEEVYGEGDKEDKEEDENEEDLD